MHQKHPSPTVHSPARCSRSPIHIYQKCLRFMAKTSASRILSTFSLDRNRRLMSKSVAPRQSGAFLQNRKSSNGDRLWSSVLMVSCSHQMSCIPEVSFFLFLFSSSHCCLCLLMLSILFFRGVRVVAFFFLSSCTCCWICTCTYSDVLQLCIL